jgi:hypothetical protein
MIDLARLTILSRAIPDRPFSMTPRAHSIEPGGLEIALQTTRLMPRTSLMIRIAVPPSTSLDGWSALAACFSE